MSGKNGFAPDAQKAKQKQATRPMLLRCVAVGTVFTLAAGALGMRLSTLQLEEGDVWQTRASNQQLHNVPITPQRGAIYDANMKALAVSNTVWTVDAAPNVMAQSRVSDENYKDDPARLAARELAALLELDEAALYEKLSDADSMYYRVKAKIDKPLADEIRRICADYSISGIYLKQDTKRYYPYEELASTVLGFTNADNVGIEGLESWYDELLSGTPGRQVTVRNAFGGLIPADDEGTTYPAINGYNLVLTLNSDIQKSLETSLAAAVAKYTPDQRAMGIVMNVNTGAILAMSAYPSYNPNDPYYIHDDVARAAVEAIADDGERSVAQGAARILQWRDKALADTYEPGSVFKILTAAAALDSGVYAENSPFNCPGTIQIADHIFPCAAETAGGAPTAHGATDLRHALINSCNVSFVQMGLGLGAQTWYDYLNAFGLTEPTGVDLPGEPGPNAIQNLVYAEEALGQVELASCSFGQSNKYTAVQMITAVSAVVNGGHLMQPYIVQKVLDSQGNVVQSFDPVEKRQVISPETSAIICDTLEELVAGTGNGHNAYVPGYRVGGKSGTSQKLELLAQDPEGKYYISSFLGFAPADDPQVAVLIALDEPHDTEKGTYFGGRLAGPSVGNVLKETLQILGVEPVFDNPEDLARTTISTPFLGEYALVDAQAALNQKGLQAVVVGNGSHVVAQYPEAGMQVPNGGKVYLYTLTEAPQETVTVPDVSGRGARSAIDALKGLGLNVLTTGAPDNGANVQAVAQDIPPGTVVPKGSVIALTLEDPSPGPVD